MTAPYTDRQITASERSQLLKLIDRPAEGRLRNTFIEHKTGYVSASEISFGIGEHVAVKLRASPIMNEPGNNCVLRIKATPSQIQESGDTVIELFNSWVKSIAILSLIGDDFIEGCDAGIALTSHIGEVMLIYITDPTESEFDCVAFSSSAPTEWLQRGWTFESTELQPEHI